MILGIVVFSLLTLLQWYFLWEDNYTKWGKGEKLAFFVATLLQTIFVSYFTTYIVLN